VRGRYWTAAAAIVVWLAAAPQALGQTNDSSWSAEASVGFDISLSGDFLSGAIGTLNGLPTIVLPQPFDDVYGTGVQFSFSGGYMVDEINEIRGQVSYQRVGSDVVELGTVASTELVGTFDEYTAWSIEGVYRHYFAPRREKLRPYASGTFGVSIINEIDAVFAAPNAGIVRFETDFYDGTAALTLGFGGGALYALSENVDVNGQIGFRYNSGLSTIDAFRDTGLEDINSKSSRWTMPISFGVRVNF
jgi:Outer membrane protein beta-barrel domain